MTNNIIELNKDCALNPCVTYGVQAAAGFLKNESVEAREEFFEAYKYATVNYLCESLLPVYRQITELLWNNSTFSFVRRNYHFYDQELGLFEDYVPTAPNGENFMGYSRIVVKVVPKLSLKRLKDESLSLRSMITKPMGNVDSELIFIVAPEAVKDEKGNLPRGFCHNAYKHYMTYAIVDKSPERAVERILTLIWRHFYQRLQKLWEKLQLESWGLAKLLRGAFKHAENTILYLFANRFSQTVVSIIENFILLCRHLWEKVKVLRLEAKIRTSLKGLTSQLKWLQNHIKEGEILNQIRSFIESVNRKLQRTDIISNERSVECSYIDNINRRASVTPLKKNFRRFPDDPEALKKREQALLELIQNQIKT